MNVEQPIPCAVLEHKYKQELERNIRKKQLRTNIWINIGCTALGAILGNIKDIINWFISI